jgi:F0F1-type ATP synthase assembly protein I
MARKDDGGESHAGLAIVGLQVAIGVGVGYVVGRWLDQRYGWTPRGMMTGSMIGLAGGLYLLIKEGMRINKD